MPSFTLIHPAVWPQQAWTVDHTDAGKACAHKFRMWALLCPFPWGSWIPIYHSVARAEAYLHAKFHLDLFNCLETVHQCHRQIRQDRTTVQQHSANYFTNSRPKIVPVTTYQEKTMEKALPYIDFSYLSCSAKLSNLMTIPVWIAFFPG